MGDGDAKCGCHNIMYVAGSSSTPGAWQEHWVCRDCDCEFTRKSALVEALRELKKLRVVAEAVIPLVESDPPFAYDALFMQQVGEVRRALDALEEKG